MKVKILFLFFVFSLGITSSLDFRINATLNDNFASLILETNSSSSSDLDSNDVIFISPPNNYSVLYSNVSGDRLVVDSWNPISNTSREIYLVYSADSNNGGNVTLTWDSTLIDSYLTLTLYEIKNSMVSSSWISMASQNNHTIEYQGEVEFKIVTSYSAPVSPEENGGSTGGGSTVPISFQVSETSLEAGYTRGMKREDSLKLNVANSNHTLTLIDILNDSIKIRVQSEPKEYILNLNEPLKVDVNEDNIYDLEVIYTKKISSYYAQISVKSINESYTSGEIPQDETLSETPEDSSGEISLPKWVYYIIYTIVFILIMGLAVFIFLKIKRDKESLEEKKTKLKSIILNSKNDLKNGKKKQAIENYKTARNYYYSSKLNNQDEDKELFNSLADLAKKLA
jgi:hypothetical protein